MELYKPLSQKLGYFNKEYEKRIKWIITLIQNNITQNMCLKTKNWELNKKIEFKIKHQKIIKEFIKDKIDVKIIKVPLEEGLLYFCGNIKNFGASDKFYKSKMITDEVNKLNKLIN